MAGDLNNARDSIIRSQLLLISVGKEMQGGRSPTGLRLPGLLAEVYQQYCGILASFNGPDFRARGLLEDGTGKDFKSHHVSEPDQGEGEALWLPGAGIYRFCWLDKE